MRSHAFALPLYPFAFAAFVHASGDFTRTAKCSKAACPIPRCWTPRYSVSGLKRAKSLATKKAGASRPFAVTSRLCQYIRGQKREGPYGSNVRSDCILIKPEIATRAAQPSPSRDSSISGKARLSSEPHSRACHSVASDKTRGPVGHSRGEDKVSILLSKEDRNGGRDKDRTCDPYDVNVVLSR